MLSTLRENFKNKPYLKVVLLGVAVGLVAYLGYYFFDPGQTAATADWAAKVNGLVIPGSLFRSEARNQDARYRQLFGEQYEQIRSQLQLGRQVVEQLVFVEIMLQEAGKLGLRATTEEISQRIVQDPDFQDAQGNFIGKERYTLLVQRVPGGVQGYESGIAREILIGKWESLVIEPATVTDRELEEVYRFRNEKTAVDYLIVRSADQELDNEVTEGQLGEWYDARREDYRRPEGRRIRYVVVERQAVLDSVEITDEEVEQSYWTNQAAYARPEERRARHILFRVEPDAPEETRQLIRKQAESVLARLQGGADFVEMAKGMSQDPNSAQSGGDLGFFGRGRMVPPFEEAAFNTPVGEFAPVVETEFGYHVIQVTDGREAGPIPLEEVQDQIRRSLQLREAQEIVEQRAAEISRESGSPDELAAVAERRGLKLDSRTVRRGDRLGDLAPSPAFTDALEQLEVGAVSRPLGVASGMAVIAVDELVDSTIAPLEDVRAQVRSDLLNQRLLDKARAAAERALQGGRDLEAAAKLLDLEVQQSGDLSPGQQIPGTGGTSPELQQALFGADTAQGQRGVVPIPAGALIYEVTLRDPFDPALFAAARDSLRAEILAQRRAALLQSILQEMLQVYQVEINPELIDRFSG